MSSHYPQRGEIWRVNMEPVAGHEQGGVRPALVVSNDIFNASMAGLVAVVPITSKARPIRSFLPIEPPEGGLRQRSYAMCDQVRTISKTRLSKKLGIVSPSTMAGVELGLKRLLDLT